MLNFRHIEHSGILTERTDLVRSPVVILRINDDAKDNQEYYMFTSFMGSSSVATPVELSHLYTASTYRAIKVVHSKYVTSLVNWYSS